MKRAERIFRALPFFGHLTDTESSNILSSSEIISLAPGDEVDCNGETNLFVILSGIMERLAPSGKGESQFLQAGAFFGKVPSVQSHPKGTLRAITDTVLLQIDSESALKQLGQSFKSYRGFIKGLHALGYPLSLNAEEYLKTNTRIVAVCGSEKSGKSLFASVLALALAREGKVLLADLSDGASSVFDNFGQRLTPPIGQRIDGTSFSINESVVDCLNGVSLLNVAFSSKVAVNPAIISPTVFALSRKYSYIIVDLPSRDELLLKEGIRNADFVLCMAGGKKDAVFADKISSMLQDGQKLVSVVNQNSGAKVSRVKGGVLFEKIDTHFPDALVRSSESEGMSFVKSIVSSRKRSLFIRPVLSGSVALLSFLSVLRELDVHFNSCYSSGLSFVLYAALLGGQSDREFLKIGSKLLRGEFLNTLFDLQFPSEKISTAKSLHKGMNSLFGDMRFEEFESHVITKLSSLESSSFFSSGLLSDAAAGAFAFPPFFEDVSISRAGETLLVRSARLLPGEMLRWPLDELFVLDCSVSGADPFPALLKLFRTMHEDDVASDAEREGYFAAQRNIILDVPFDGNNLNKFVQDSRPALIKKLSEYGIV